MSVDLASATLVQLLDTEDGLPDERIRGLVTLSGRTALASAGDTLWKLEWIQAQDSNAFPIATGLAEPWGLAPDPTEDGRVFVADGPRIGRSIR